ncbi:type III effector [Pseudomonas syringae pv. cerasicola]|nr:type III effector [Pseudomonas syringae pv. cerasicola]PHN78508.1 type III effector [Pseudomonas syringae pv. cerasicola]PHN79655.1 type III effector [Pseudomonas syringae pv. cerasicola]
MEPSCDFEHSLAGRRLLPAGQINNNVEAAMKPVQSVSATQHYNPLTNLGQEASCSHEISGITQTEGMQATAATEQLTTARVRDITAAAKVIPDGTTVMSRKPEDLSQLQTAYLAAKNAPTHPDLYLKLCETFRVHDERHASEGHENICAKTMTARIDDDAIRVMAYASRGMHGGDVNNFLKFSFNSGLPNPISSALPSMLTFGASSFIGAVHGPWSGFGSALAFAVAKPFMAGGIQPAIVSLCDNIRGRNAPTVLAKGEVNDEIWLDAAAQTLEGLNEDTRRALTSFGDAVQAAITSVGIRDPKFLETDEGLESFFDHLSDTHFNCLREALEGVNNALQNTAPQTRESLRALEEASRPNMLEQRETTLKAEFSNLRQKEGNDWQRIPRSLRASGGTLTSGLSGLKRDEIPTRMNPALDRKSHFEGLNALASPAVGTSYAAAISLLQSPMAGLDERNKQKFNVKAAIVFYDAFTPEGKQRYLAGEEMDPDRDVDQAKLRGVFTSVSEYMVKSTQENLKQRQKVLGVEISEAGHALNALPENTSSITPPEIRAKVERYKALSADMSAVTQAIREGNPNFLTDLPDGEVKKAFDDCVNSGGMHVLENMTKVKYAKQGELKAQWTQKVSTDVSMFGLAGQFTPSIVNKLAAAICGGAGHIPNAVVGFLGAYSLAASFIGAQTQFAAINAKNNFREGNPKPTSLETFMRGNLAPVMQASANRHSQHALQGAEQAISTARQALNSSLGQNLRRRPSVLFHKYQ